MLHRLVARLLPVLLVAACGGGAAQPAGGTPSTAQGAPVEGRTEVLETEGVALGSELTVVTTVFPLASLASAIAPDAEVTLLTAGGQDPHDLELSPSDRALIETADVVLFLGDLDFQPQVEAAVGQTTGQVVSVAEVVGSDALHAFDGHHHKGADGDAGDPHIWFEASLMAEVAEAIGAAFAAVDTTQADAFTARAAAAQDELVALDGEIDAILASCDHDEAIVSHAAYAYLLEPRGLHQEGISGAGGHGGASPQRLVELTERIRSEGIPAVLAEPVEGRADAQSLATEAGVDLLDIDPLEVGSDELVARGYPAALRAQAETFAVALACG